MDLSNPYPVCCNHRAALNMLVGSVTGSINQKVRQTHSRATLECADALQTSLITGTGFRGKEKPIRNRLSRLVPTSDMITQCCHSWDFPESQAPPFHDHWRLQLRHTSPHKYTIVKSPGTLQQIKSFTVNVYPQKSRERGQ